MIFSSQRCFQKKWTNKFEFTTMLPQVDLFFFVFWKNLKIPRRHFEINWLLESRRYKMHFFKRFSPSSLSFALPIPILTNNLASFEFHNLATLMCKSRPFNHVMIWLPTGFPIVHRANFVCFAEERKTAWNLMPSGSVKKGHKRDLLL